MQINAPALNGKAVHLWAFDLALAMEAEVEEGAQRTLDGFERERLAKLVFARDRVRYQRSHLWMRHVLGAYLGMEAADVPLQQDGKRKPEISGVHDLSFNLAHSEDVALLAVSRVPHVGVDVEVFGGHRDLHATARGVCTPQEQEELGAFEPDRFEHALLMLWTRKEAVLKSMGVGLKLDPADLHVGLKNCDHAAAIRVAVPPGAYGDTIDVANVRVSPDYISAVAAPHGWDSLTLLPGDASRPSS